MSSTLLNTLPAPLAGSPYVAYSYAYPHKTAYRPLPSQRALSEVWREEPRDSLFLYLHVPFCEHRCGFCNLFTLARPDASLPRQYLAALRRQADATRESLGAATFTRLAIGGGTPTFLSVEELAELLDIAQSVGANVRELGASCEASPATITAEKLALLREWGVKRLSLGIESFSDDDAHALGRPQRTRDVEQALMLLREAGFPGVNLDLIYGGESQTLASWLASLKRAIDYRAEEIYLYPLYVRPLTGLGRVGRSWDDWRLTLYRAGRDLLLEQGYEQVSMRMFQRCGLAESSGPEYCCQADGMIGLGCGARSYTRMLHYSREYAVGSRAVAGILADYLGRTAREFAMVDFGIELDINEQRRRWLILSLLPAAGLLRQDYAQRFGTDVLAHFPELLSLVECGLAMLDERLLRLTPAGLERSDAIGPWLYSQRVQRLSEDYAWS